MIDEQTPTTVLRAKLSTTGNKGFAIAGVPCFVDTFVVNQTLVLCINICGKNRLLRQARNRYLSGKAGSVGLHKLAVIDNFYSFV